MEGRSGSKVKESYHRYYFESAKEACSYLNKMRNQKIKLLQKKKKYRRVKSHYTISKKEGKGSIFLCSRELKDRKRAHKIRKKINLNCLFLLDLRPFVVAKLVSNTVSTHLQSNSPPK